MYKIFRELEEQNKRAKTYKSYDKDELIDEILKDEDEIERLNNIINDFDKWLLGEKMMFYKGSDGEELIRYVETTNKWLELKGSGKE